MIMVLMLVDRGPARSRRTDRHVLARSSPSTARARSRLARCSCTGPGCPDTGAWSRSPSFSDPEQSRRDSSRTPNSGTQPGTISCYHAQTFGARSLGEIDHASERSSLRRLLRSRRSPARSAPTSTSDCRVEQAGACRRSGRRMGSPTTAMEDGRDGRARGRAGRADGWIDPANLPTGRSRRRGGITNARAMARIWGDHRARTATVDGRRFLGPEIIATAGAGAELRRGSDDRLVSATDSDSACTPTSTRRRHRRRCTGAGTADRS